MVPTTTPVALTPRELGFIEGGYLTALALLGVTGEPAAVFIVGQRIMVSASIVTGAAIVLLSGPLWSLRSSAEGGAEISSGGGAKSAQ